MKVKVAVGDIVTCKLASLRGKRFEVMAIRRKHALIQREGHKGAAAVIDISELEVTDGK